MRYKCNTFIWGSYCEDLLIPFFSVKRKECNLRKEKLLGDSLCGAQTPQRVNGSIQLCFMSIVYMDVSLNKIINVIICL